MEGNSYYGLHTKTSKDDRCGYTVCVHSVHWHMCGVSHTLKCSVAVTDCCKYCGTGRERVQQRRELFSYQSR
ncbi:hypothetical protein J6590_059123 [Homalodisca vitripennis]|nr:hypothetical protein J6590_059123 [Homalodisca vitripennis]